MLFLQNFVKVSKIKCNYVSKICRPFETVYVIGLLIELLIKYTGRYELWFVLFIKKKILTDFQLLLQCLNFIIYSKLILYFDRISIYLYIDFLLHF